MLCSSVLEIKTVLNPQPSWLLRKIVTVLGINEVPIQKSLDTDFW